MKKDGEALKESEKEVDQLESTLKEIQNEVGIDPETGEQMEEEADPVSEDKENKQELSAQGNTPVSSTELSNVKDVTIPNAPQRSDYPRTAAGLREFKDAYKEYAGQSEKTDEMKSQGIDPEALNTINEEVKKGNPLQGSDVPSPGTLKKVEKKDPEKSLVKMERLEKTNMSQLKSPKKKKPRTIVVHTQIIEKPVPLEIY